MGNFIDQLSLTPKDISSYFSIWELLIALTLSFLLCSFVAYVYRATHTGVSYSQSFVHTLILVGVVICVIMLIIGSNIARAFTLVGALSIIRFRNAVKETRDVGFVFLSMAIGMACGTRFFGSAIIFTFLVSGMSYLLFALDAFARPVDNKILRINIPDNLDPDTVFQNVFYQYLQSHSLLSMETVRQGVFTELVYSVILKKGISSKEFLDELRKINGNAKVMLTGGSADNI